MTACELVDRACVMVELFEATSTAQLKWKERWLRDACELLNKEDECEKCKKLKQQLAEKEAKIREVSDELKQTEKILKQSVKDDSHLEEQLSTLFEFLDLPISSEGYWGNAENPIDAVTRLFSEKDAEIRDFKQQIAEKEAEIVELKKLLELAIPERCKPQCAVRPKP